MKRIGNITAAVLVIVLCALASCKSDERGKVPKNTLASAEETVGAYCELDAKGTRLTSATWSKILPLIAWQEEAGWDLAVVISGYSVGKPDARSDQAVRVMVEYQVLGFLSKDYIPSRKTEKVTFQVTRTAAGWKITDPDFLPPHVHTDAIIRHLEETKNLETARKIATDEKE